MTVDELVAQLQDFPGYWTVAVRVTELGLDELTGDSYDRDHTAVPTVVEAVQDLVHQTPRVVIA